MNRKIVNVNVSRNLKLKAFTVLVFAIVLLGFAISMVTSVILNFYVPVFPYVLYLMSQGLVSPTGFVDFPLLFILFVPSMLLVGKFCDYLLQLRRI